MVLFSSISLFPFSSIPTAQIPSSMYSFLSLFPNPRNSSSEEKEDEYLLPMVGSDTGFGPVQQIHKREFCIFYNIQTKFIDMFR